MFFIYLAAKLIAIWIIKNYAHKTFEFVPKIEK